MVVFIFEYTIPLRSAWKVSIFCRKHFIVIRKWLFFCACTQLTSSDPSEQSFCPSQRWPADTQPPPTHTYSFWAHDVGRAAQTQGIRNIKDKTGNLPSNNPIIIHINLHVLGQSVPWKHSSRTRDSLLYIDTVWNKPSCSFGQREVARDFWLYFMKCF